MKIILINGKKRSGKDYVARCLKSELEKQGYKTEIMAFADPIKDIISDSLNISVSSLDEYKNNPYKFNLITKDEHNSATVEQTNYRLVLQRFGTEAMKKYFGEDVWVKLLLERASKQNVDFVLVADFRFMIEVISEYTVHVRNNSNKSTDTHRSETELDNFKFAHYVDNTDYSDISSQIKELADNLIR